MRLASRPVLRRLLALDQMLRAEEYPNATTAGQRLEVNPRTIHRDLEFLRDSWGAPLAFSHKHNGYYYREPTYALPLLQLSEGEVVALFLAERVLEQYQGSPFARELAAAYEKLTAALPDEVSVDLEHLRDTFSVSPVPASTVAVDLFRQLTRAVRERRQLRITYWTASRNVTTERVIDPYHLASVRGEWYCVAYCHTRRKPLMFAPGRMRDVRETGERFDRPGNFDAASYLDPAFGAVRGDGPPITVRLQFAPEAARYVREKRWHRTQRLEEQPGGGIILALEVGHLLEVKRWVLSWGAACAVIEPRQLRKAVRDELAATWRLYRKTP